MSERPMIIPMTTTGRPPKVTGGSAEVLCALLADPETWQPLLDQLVPEPVRLAERAKRISLGYQRGILDALRGWKYHSDYDKESK